MNRKKKIYYTRTYRHLKKNHLKSVLYLLIFILPCLIIFSMNLAQFNKVYIRYRGCCSGQGVSRDTHVYFQGCVFIPGHD